MIRSERTHCFSGLGLGPLAIASAATLACGNTTSPPSASAPRAAETSSASTAASASAPTTSAARDAGGGSGGGSSSSPSFADDVEFLGQHGDVIVLADPSGGRVALSPTYQGRVMTSAVSATGQSFGWINRAFIVAKKTATQFDNYGGEDRFWLGPEGGQYGLYFDKGKPFAFSEWQVPHAMQEGAWDVEEQTPTSVTFKRTMKISNWTGTSFDIGVRRTVRLVPLPDAIARAAKGANGAGAQAVAYETKNEITNAGKNAWTRQGGLPSVWILAMFTPSNDTRIIVPFEKSAKGPIVNDAYFGKVPADRLSVHEDKGALVFVGDGKHRSKIGLGPARAKADLGSYSASARLLTVVHYDGPIAGKPYVNSMWEKQKDPYGGDVVNSYNDGPPEPGKPPLGPFYEIETSSPGAELAPGKSLVHTHRTFHFVGDDSALDAVAKATLGVSVAAITRPAGGG